MSLLHSRWIITEIRVARRREKLGQWRLFRSYAGMTRIRFKGPAQRHLSIVKMLPSECLDVVVFCACCQWEAKARR